MVLPIVVGIGATVVALTLKTTVSAVRKFNLLTPSMIASLNNIKVAEESPRFSNHPHATQHQYLRNRFPNLPFSSRMTEQEALLIMGIEGNDIMKLNKTMLKTRYRQLMIMNHPDKNGSQYLTQKINQAKDTLEKSYLMKNK